MNAGKAKASAHNAEIDVSSVPSNKRASSKSFFERELVKAERALGLTTAKAAEVAESWQLKIERTQARVDSLKAAIQELGD